MLARNRELSNHKLSAVLLAHLLVFKEFLTVAHAQNGTVSEVQKRRWLLAQVSTALIHWRDPYRELSSFIYGMSLNAIEEQLTSTLSAIKLLLPDAVARDGFFIAIDEANFAMRELWSSLPGDTGPFPMLKEILCAWKEKLALFTDFPVTFVVAGIEIPQATFPPSSPEWSAWKWTSDTGSFDEPEAQKRYILPFISPSIMKLATGEALVRRIWDWCRPRQAQLPFIFSLLADCVPGIA
ncbi:hypothetical protein H0H87_004421 [Tephrocybe sp. NHM501043]|nr:hypothetical protein H0H87_004421 [Tephrocybe sp. NHM501043]